jgi:DMSO/TMAO reductase YedYZ heme-binding membrane subunit
MSMWKKIASQLSVDITIEKTSLQESEWKELKVCAYLALLLVITILCMYVLQNVFHPLDYVCIDASYAW